MVFSDGSMQKSYNNLFLTFKTLCTFAAAPRGIVHITNPLNTKSMLKYLQRPMVCLPIIYAYCFRS